MRCTDILPTPNNPLVSARVVMVLRECSKSVAIQHRNPRHHCLTRQGYQSAFRRWCDESLELFSIPSSDVHPKTCTFTHLHLDANLNSKQDLRAYYPAPARRAPRQRSPSPSCTSPYLHLPYLSKGAWVLYEQWLTDSDAAGTLLPLLTRTKTPA